MFNQWYKISPSGQSRITELLYVVYTNIINLVGFFFFFYSHRFAAIHPDPTQYLNLMLRFIHGAFDDSKSLSRFFDQHERI